MARRLMQFAVTITIDDDEEDNMTLELMAGIVGVVHDHLAVETDDIPGGYTATVSEVTIPV
jgi:hypothetical protein